MCVLYLEKNNTFGDTDERGVEKSTHARVSKNESTREVKRFKFRERHRCKRKNKSRRQKIFLFFRCHVSQNRGQTLGEKVSRISEREDDIGERARARFISHFIYLSRRERQRIKSDDDDDDASSSSRPRSRSLFLLVGEY